MYDQANFLYKHCHYYFYLVQCDFADKPHKALQR